MRIKNYGKLILQVGLLSLLILSLTACSSGNTSDESLNMDSLEENIKESVDLSSMEKGSRSDLEKLYNIDEDDVDDFILYRPASNISAEEILVLEVDDFEDIDSIKDKIKLRLDSQESNFKDYLPDEHFLIEKHVLKSKGDYILFVISEEVEEVESLFTKAFD